MNARQVTLFVLLAIAAGSTSQVRADGKLTAARELAEWALMKFGVKAAQEGTEALAGRIAAATARHGDDVLAAVRKVGPRALGLADEAGEQAPRVLRLLSQHGDDALRIVSRPQGMALLTRYGDDAAEVLIKHPGIAEPLLASLGKPAIQAMGSMGAQSGRRLAMMAQGGELAAIGRTPELLGVIAQHGDRAMEFIWRHKAVLAGGAALGAFLTHPEPYLEGARDLATVAGETTVNLASVAGEATIKPVVHAVGGVVQTGVSMLGWLLGLALVVLAGGAALALKCGALDHPAARRLIKEFGGKFGERVLAAWEAKK